MTISVGQFRDRSWRAEAIVVVSLCLTCLAVNVLTATWYPAPYMDEVQLADPAVNLVQGRGWTSTTWPGQPSWEFWASYSPLYSVLLAGWLRLFGINATVVRSLDAVLVSLSAALFWWATVRLGLLYRFGARLALVGLLLTSASLSYLARFGRVEAVQLLLVAGTLVSFSLRRPLLRSALLFAFALLYPATGLQLAAFAAVIGLLLLVFFGRGFLRPVLLLGAGCAVGFALLLAFYAAHGVLLAYLTRTVAGHTTLSGDLLQLALIRDEKVVSHVQRRIEGLKEFWRIYSVDPSFVPLLAVLMPVAVCPWLRREHPRGSVTLFCLLAALVVPPSILLLAKYPFYYSWMGSLPAVFGVCRAVEAPWRERASVVLRFGVCLPLLCAAWLGLPQQLCTTSRTQREEFGQVEDFVRSAVRPDDWVYGEAIIYYPTIQRAERYFFVEYAEGRRLPEIPEDERRHISVLIVPADRLAASVQKVGGAWAATGEHLSLTHEDSPAPEYGNPLIPSPELIERRKVTLYVYRRQGHDTRIAESQT